MDTFVIATRVLALSGSLALLPLEEATGSDWASFPAHAPPEIDAGSNVAPARAGGSSVVHDGSASLVLLSDFEPVPSTLRRLVDSSEHHRDLFDANPFQGTRELDSCAKHQPSGDTQVLRVPRRVGHRATIFDFTHAS